MVTTNTQAARTIAAVSRDQLEALVLLQETEIEIEDIRLKLSHLPEKLAAEGAILDEFLLAVEKKKAERDTLLKIYRSFEADLETNQARVSKREAQLKDVKTNKEYQVVLKEIRDIGGKSSEIEDKTLKCLDEIDVLDDAVKQKEKDCLSVQSRVESKKDELERDAEKLRKKLVLIEKKGEEIRSTLDENLLAQYGTIRKQAGGSGIVEVCDAVCLGCHLNIPPQMYNDLHKKDTLQICPHCSRLIYVGLGE
ncbi:MAG: hypothetical protein GXP53_11430 [Deltaproteobacteria bacterium]|nr:hypothetical protein [Deltaproteobacteria bacterium]